MSEISIGQAEPAEVTAPPMEPRTYRLLHGPIVPTLIRMALPNVLVMLAQAFTGLIETWWLSHLGTDVLAGMALVFPGVMLIQMVSGGAIGGGISSAIARSLGGGRRETANALVLHAILINIGFALFFSVVMIVFGTPFYRLLGGRGAELEAAVTYSNIVFGGSIFLWLMNAFASVIRGTGNMSLPAGAICISVIILVPLSPLLIFGWGPVPAMGVAGGGTALVLSNALVMVLLGWYVLSGRNLARFTFARLQWVLFSDVLRVGAVAAVSALQTNFTIILATSLVASYAGAQAVAGYGTGARLEYLLIPVVFGLGAPLMALVGTNIGAGQTARALRIAFTGAGIAFAITETVGIVAAIWPHAWLSLFSADPQMMETGAVYLRIVGPTFGFFGMGLALYFASQGAGRLLWPLLAGACRVVVAVGGGWLTLRLTGSLNWLFAALAVGLVLYGVGLLAAVGSGVWFRERR